MGMGGNIFAGLLEGLGKSLAGYGSGELENQNKLKLAKEGNLANLAIYKALAPNANWGPVEAMLLGDEKSKSIMPRPNGESVNQSGSVNPGDIVGGYKFVGGDPNNQTSWIKVK